MYFISFLWMLLCFSAEHETILKWDFHLDYHLNGTSFSSVLVGAGPLLVFFIWFLGFRLIIATMTFTAEWIAQRVISNGLPQDP